VLSLIISEALLKDYSVPSLFSRLFKFYRGDAYFNLLGHLIWPLIIQNLINSSLNMVNTLMIGQNGDAAVAAVALSGQVFFLLNLTLFGIGSGSAMFTAQLWGKRDIPNIRKVLGLCLSLSLIDAGIFLVVAEVFPTQALAIYTEDPAVIALGAEYLRLFGWSFVFFAITFSFALILRSIGEVKVPVAVSVVTLILNTVLAYTFIFGAFGSPKMGINGAALATLISRVLECIALLALTYRNPNAPAAARLSDLISFNREYIVRVLKPVLPVAFNEMLWSFGITTYSAIYARMGTESIDAINIVGNIEIVAYTFFWAMNGAGSVMIGNAIGAGDEETAYRHAGRSLLLVLIGATITGALMYYLSGFVLDLFKVSPLVIENTRHVLTVSCSFFWIRAMNGFIIVAILRSGGDTNFALVLDGIIIWVVGVPLAAAGAFLFGAPVQIVYLCAMSEEVTKWIFGLRRYFSRKWIHNLTQVVDVEQQLTAPSAVE
jgi:MATE family, multidrug efflux pump